MEYELSSSDYDILSITGFVLLFLHWTVQEILERKFGLKPKITVISELEQVAAQTNHPEDALMVHSRYCTTLRQFVRDEMHLRGDR